MLGDQGLAVNAREGGGPSVPPRARTVPTRWQPWPRRQRSWSRQGEGVKLICRSIDGPERGSVCRRLASGEEGWR